MEGFDIDGITQKVKDVAGDLGKKTEDTIEITKVRSQIHSLERENDRDYTELGKMVFAKYKNEEEIDGDFTDLCGAINQRNEQIADQQAQIDKIKGVS